MATSPPSTLQTVAATTSQPAAESSSTISLPSIGLDPALLTSTDVATATASAIASGDGAGSSEVPPAATVTAQPQVDGSLGQAGLPFDISTVVLESKVTVNLGRRRARATGRV